MKYSEIKEFEVDGKKYALNDDTVLFLVPELLEENLKKIDSFFQNEKYFDYGLHSGLRVFEQKDGFYRKYGYKNELGYIVIPAIYDMAYDFCEGLARVYNNECRQYGYINPKNEMVKEYQFIAADNFSNGMARVKNYNCQKHQYLWGYIDKNFDWKKQPILLEASNYNEGRARIKINEEDGYVLIDKNGNLTMTLNDLNLFNDELIRIINTNDDGINLCEIIDINGQYRTYDNSLKSSFTTLKMIEKIRIRNLTNMASLVNYNNIFAYNLLTRSYGIVNSFRIGEQSKILLKK